MLNTTSQPQFAETNDQSAVSNDLSESGCASPADLTAVTRYSSPAEMVAGLTMPAAAADLAALNRYRSAAPIRSPLEHPRIEVRTSRAAVTAARPRPRPLSLVPQRLKRHSQRKTARVSLMGVRVDCVTERQVTAHVISSIRAGAGGWIATPNVDHLRIISERPGLLGIVNEASLRVADGMPLVWASRLQGTPLPERITGAGLALSLTAAAAKEGASIFLLGGDPGDAEAAADALKRLNPDLKIAGIMCPPADFEHDAHQMTQIGNALHSARPDLVYSCFGFPKQELVIRALRECLPSAWFLGLGGSLAIVSGRTPRAPRWIQEIGMEWAWRLGLEPRRLFHRYIVRDLPFVFRLLGNALVQH
jgi:N-acetylglucosaminyldiphosphoundecaprenol N-acetyl-beta-D-mannosaminyltransferase